MQQFADHVLLRAAPSRRAIFSHFPHWFNSAGSRGFRTSLLPAGLLKRCPSTGYLALPRRQEASGARDGFPITAIFPPKVRTYFPHLARSNEPLSALISKHSRQVGARAVTDPLLRQRTIKVYSGECWPRPAACLRRRQDPTRHRRFHSRPPEIGFAC
jgi:hypothetical protein